MDRSQGDRVEMKATPDRDSWGAIHAIFDASRAELHAEAVEVTGAFGRAIGRIGNLDIMLGPAGATGSTEVMTGRARTPIKYWPEAVASVASGIMLNPGPLKKLTPPRELALSGWRYRQPRIDMFGSLDSTKPSGRRRRRPEIGEMLQWGWPRVEPYGQFPGFLVSRPRGRIGVNHRPDGIDAGRRMCRN
jgi:hypothetical protein